MSQLWMNIVDRESLIAADDMWGLLVIMCGGEYVF